MVKLPIFFQFQELVLGKGFAAGVDVNGRALLEIEDGDVWIAGVQPGAIADHGPDVGAALAQFRIRFKQYLVDAAKQAADFDGYRAELVRFFDETDAATVAEWDEARARVRAGSAPTEALANCAKETGTRTAGITVTHLALTPDQNPRVDPAPLAVAA